MSDLHESLHDDDETPHHLPPPDDRGALDVWMAKWLGRSWRTTIFGVVALGCSLVEHVPGAPAWAKAMASTVESLALSAGLLTAKDRQVWSLPKPQRKG